MPTAPALSWLPMYLEVLSSQARLSRNPPLSDADSQGTLHSLRRWLRKTLECFVTFLLVLTGYPNVVQVGVDLAIILPHLPKCL